jgi:hypothetical protein
LGFGESSGVLMGCYKLTCPLRGNKHSVEDEDYYEDEKSENYRSDPAICWPCYLRMEDMRAIGMISNFIDSLTDEQRDMAADLFEKLCSSTSEKEKSLFGRIIREHFKGREGIRTWGLW